MIEYILIIVCLLIILCIVFLVNDRTKVKPINIEKIEEKSALEEVIDALENTTAPERSLTTYEQEQEENAIISYQELVRAVEIKKAKLKEDNEPPLVTKVESVSEFEMVDKIVEQKPDEILSKVAIETSDSEMMDKIELEIDDSKKFQSSEFISPIFGKDNINDDFLKELKDFRSNL